MVSAPPTPVTVMHLVTNLGYDGRTGGTEYGVIKLANALDREQVRTSVCSSYQPDATIAGLLSPDVPRFHCGRVPGNDVRWVWRLWRLLRRERPDIVHTHGWGTLVEGLTASRLAGVPRVIHGEHGTLQRRAYQLAVQRWAWRGADEVTAVSARLADRLARDVGFPRERICVIRNGVDLQRFSPDRRPQGRRQLGVDDQTLCIGTVGRLLPVKDHANLVDALALCAASGLRFRAFIAGDGPLRADLQAQMDARGVAGSVTILGHRPDVESVVAAFDIFVLPSRSEGLSNTIQEAMASGVSVVATNVGGADEMVTEGVNGLLVPRERPDLLADAMLNLATSPQLRSRMALENRRRAEREFGLEHMLAGYRTLYLHMSGCLDRVERVSHGH